MPKKEAYFLKWFSSQEGLKVIQGLLQWVDNRERKITDLADLIYNVRASSVPQMGRVISLWSTIRHLLHLWVPASMPNV